MVHFYHGVPTRICSSIFACQIMSPSILNTTLDSMLSYASWMADDGKNELFYCRLISPQKDIELDPAEMESFGFHALKLLSKSQEC